MLIYEYVHTHTCIVYPLTNELQTKKNYGKLKSHANIYILAFVYFQLLNVDLN